MRKVCLITLGTMILGLTISACSKSKGREIYETSGCPQCHGIDGNGSSKAPPLMDLQYVWTEQELERYLKDPSKYIAKDDRLKELSRRYNTIMPAFLLDDSNRLELARYLLDF